MVNIGEKIRRYRQKLGLTQEELAARTELSKGFISQLERDLTSPSIATLTDILEALGTNLSEFFTEARTEKIVFTSEDMFEKEETEAGYVVRWLVPNAQKNCLEPIMITLEPGGSTYEENPPRRRRIRIRPAWKRSTPHWRRKVPGAQGRQFLLQTCQRTLDTEYRQDRGSAYMGSHPSFLLNNLSR